MCRWPNGDLSFVSASNKTKACYRLDEFGSVDPEHLEVVTDKFMIDLSLTDQGEFEASFSEYFQDTIDEQYPILEEAKQDNWEDGSEDPANRIKIAITQEKERVQWEDDKQASTEKGRWLQEIMGCSATVADIYVDEERDESQTEHDEIETSIRDTILVDRL